jgi:RimJ/RimL family protein N-acetyltransferase
MILTTRVDRLALRPLVPADLDVYVALVDANRVHLTSRGDYEEMRSATREDLMVDLSAEGPARFGAWLGEALIGRIDLIPRDGGDAVLGYWLDEGHTGRGYATEACRAVIDFGRRTLDVTDVWAGVTKGNEPSERLLDRLGFEPVADMGSYTRFHRSLR